MESKYLKITKKQKMPIFTKTTYAKKGSSSNCLNIDLPAIVSIQWDKQVVNLPEVACGLYTCLDCMKGFHESSLM